MDVSPERVYAKSSLDPLPPDVRHGMIAMGIFGLLSTISTLTLLVFITYRMTYWRRYYAHPIATNQIFILIYNLLLADFQQALSFVLAFHWIYQDKLVGPSSACFAQGWLIQIGDLSSGLWVLAIAVHTFINLVGQKYIPMAAFLAAVVAVWIFALVLTAIGPIQYGIDFFVPAGAWCWIPDNHERDRLTLHYLWIFISQLGSLVIYITIFFYLRIRVASSINTQKSASQNSSIQASNSVESPVGVTTTTIVSQPVTNPFAVSRHRILRTARYMVVYPFAYMALTLPLASGRVWAMARKNPPSLMFYCAAGTLMASCGVVDVVLYIYTRKALVKSSIGLKIQNPTRDALTRFRTADSRRGGADTQMMRMSGVKDAIVDDDGSNMEQDVALESIMISKSVTCKSEVRFGASIGSPVYANRTDSIKNLAADKDDDDYRARSHSSTDLVLQRDERDSDKSWQ
ncbi:hypothetical protein LSUE1_G006811 [Lachnellula suecica]|uniref:G protein-coupled receptor GPR1/2/3 C-terminal domain-containing protein n=1 Tax=Lachnellula suecica TaxID=602035 RepID=A0A8T9C9W1_9HELO|nr:hypothetical protein LSUE1_G006811 [Lachnellula suecica]